MWTSVNKSQLEEDNRSTGLLPVRPSRWLITACLALWLMPPAPAASEVTLRLTPVDPPANTGLSYPPGTIVDTAGGSITLPGGLPVQVWLEARWTAPGITIKSDQNTISGSTGFNSSDAGGTPLFRPSLPCVGDPECAGAYGTGSECSFDTLCEQAFWDPALALLDFTACNSVADDMFCGETTLFVSPQPFPLPEGYGGTYVIAADDGARGTYTLGFDPTPAKTFLQDENLVIVPVDTMIPATITFLDPPAVSLRLVPVDPPANTGLSYPTGTIVDTTSGHITLPGGVPTRIWLEARWTAPGILVSSDQNFISGSTGFNSSDAGGTSLFRPSVACVGDPECAGTFGTGSGCFTDTLCEQAFWDPARVLLDLTATDSSTDDMGCGETVVSSPAQPFPLPEGYGGTYVIEADAGARGNYTLGFDPGPTTFLRDENLVLVPIGAMTPATITFLDPAPATLRLVPVDPPANTGLAYPPGTIVDTTSGSITLPGGVPTRIWLEARWSAPGITIKSDQNTISGSTGFDSSNAGGTPLFRAAEPCMGDPECAAAYGTGSECFDDALCEEAFWDPPRALLDLTACDSSSDDMACGETAISVQPQPFPLPEGYGGTYVIEADAGARGVYTLGFDPSPAKTFLLDENFANVPIDVMIPATISFLEPGPPQIRLTPVDPPTNTGLSYPPGTIVDTAGGSITLPGGMPTRIWLEARWTAPGFTIKTDQNTISGSTGFNSSDAGGTPLFRPSEPCVDDPECANAYGTGSDCFVDDLCEQAFWDPPRILFDLWACNSTGDDMVCGETANSVPPQPFPIPEGYGGTYVIEADAGARGTYTLGFDPSPTKTFLQDENSVTIPIDAMIPATISFVGSDSPLPGDDTCYDGSNNLGTPCSIDDDCDPGQVCGLKSRGLTVSFGTAARGTGGEGQSIKVTIADLDDALGLDAREGEVWWAGPAEAISNAPNADLTGAQLICEPTPSTAEQWPAGDLHLFGAAIVPDSRYEVRLCDETGSICSDPLEMATGKWGEIVPPFVSTPSPNFGDISAVVDKFRGIAAAPDMSRTDLVGPGNPPAPNMLDHVADFFDISAIVDAFRGDPYPYTVPACP